MTTGRLPVALSLLAMAAAAHSSPRTHQITPEDFFTIANPGGLALSGDGKQAAWVQSYWDKESDGQKKELWRMTLPEGQPERLTFSEENEGAPQFSHDGTHLFFLKAESRGETPQAPYNGKPQIFRLTLATGDMVPLTREKEGVSQFALGPKGQALWYTGNKEHRNDDTFAAMRQAHSAPQYGHGTVTVNPLYRLDLNSYRSELVLDDNKVVWAFDVSPDGNRIARVITDDNELVHLEGWSDIALYDREQQRGWNLPDQAWRDQAPSPYGWLMQPRWSPDGSRLAFRIDYDGYPGQLFVTELNGKGDVVSQADLTRSGDVTLNGDNIAWRPDSDEICYRGSEHARVRLYCTEMDGTEQGKTRTLTDGDFVVGGYAFSRNGRELALTHNGLDHFYDIYTGRVGTMPERRTDLNPQVASWQLPQLSIVRWTAPDGKPVEGILELPPGYQKEDGALPLVVQIHGGPTAATPFALQHRTYGRSTFAAKGWALLSPNYRGSTGYGDPFLVDLVGREHDIEVADILAGVDTLIAEGIVDGDKLAVMGWSNGGYLTNALISTTDRFKAASSGAGVWDQRLQWMLEDTPGHVINFMQGLPWEQPQAYDHGSSLSHAASIKTPTLIHMGENDARVPAPHAHGLYRTLQQYLNVPTELLIYPGEGHGLTTYQHKLAKMQWDLVWFEHYVLGKPVE